MKNVFLKIIMGIMLVTILNTGYVLANAVASPETLERHRKEDLRRLIKENPRAIELHSKEDQKEIHNLIKQDATTQKELRDLIKEEPEFIKYLSKEDLEAIQAFIKKDAIQQKKEELRRIKTAQKLKTFTTYVFISITAILIILAGFFGLIYIKTQKNKSDSSHNTED